jgi:hypothetical protein
MPGAWGGYWVTRVSWPPRARLVQGAVTCGIWWCLLIDVIGNWAGQSHSADSSFVPIIVGTAVVLVFTHPVALARVLDR